MPRRHELTDAQWERVKGLLPVKAGDTVTTDHVSEAFAHPVVVGYDEGRWTARAKATRIIEP